MSKLHLLIAKTINVSWIGGATIGAYLKAHDNIKNSEPDFISKISWGVLGTLHGAFLGAGVAPFIVLTLPITIPAYLTQKIDFF